MSSPLYPPSLSGGVSALVLVLLVDYMFRETFGRSYDLLSFVVIYIVAAAARIGTHDILTAAKMMSQALQGTIHSDIFTGVFYLVLFNLLTALKAYYIIREVPQMAPTESFVSGVLLALGLLTNFNFLNYLLEKVKEALSLKKSAEVLTAPPQRSGEQRSSEESPENPVGAMFEIFGKFTEALSASQTPSKTSSSPKELEEPRPRARRIRVQASVEKSAPLDQQELDDLLD